MREKVKKGRCDSGAQKNSDIRIRTHGSVTSTWNGQAVRTSANEALSNMSSRRSRTFAKLSLLI